MPNTYDSADDMVEREVFLFNRRLSWLWLPQGRRWSSECGSVSYRAGIHHVVGDFDDGVYVSWRLILGRLMLTVDRVNRITREEDMYV